MFSLGVGGWRLGYEDSKSEDVGLIVHAISFQDFQPMWSWSTNVTDRRTDGRHCGRNTAPLCTIVHRAVKNALKSLGLRSLKPSTTVLGFRSLCERKQVRVYYRSGTGVRCYLWARQTLRFHSARASWEHSSAWISVKWCHGRHFETLTKIRLRQSMRIWI